MSADDVVKAHRDQQLSGVPVGDEAICACGVRYIPFPGDDAGTGGCGECSYSRFLIQKRERAEWEKLRDELRAAPRPKLGQPYRQLWLDVRKPPFWKAAAVRNRCHCGARVAATNFGRYLGMCTDCVRTHHRNRIWDAVVFRSDPELGRKLAARYEEEAFLASLTPSRIDRLSPWKERTQQISGGAAVRLDPGTAPGTQPTVGFNEEA